MKTYYVVLLSFMIVITDSCKNKSVAPTSVPLGTFRIDSIATIYKYKVNGILIDHSNLWTTAGESKVFASAGGPVIWDGTAVTDGSLFNASNPESITSLCFDFPALTTGSWTEKSTASMTYTSSGNSFVPGTYIITVLKYEAVGGIIGGNIFRCAC